MTEVPPATLRLSIDRSALAQNWHTLDRLSGTARAGAAIKADCYGLGVDLCLPALVGAGARDFFVAHWSEVPPALRHIEAAQLSVLHGVNSAAEAGFAISTGVRPVINSLHQAQVWNEAGGGACHLMVDTGINRLGVAVSELGDSAIGRLDVHALMSHLACADEDSHFNARQLHLFEQARSEVAHRETSLANSAGLTLSEAYHHDLTRPGLALYGGVPRPELHGLVRQVAYPQAMVLQRRRLTAGDRVGYNGRFVAPADMDVATVSIGYADGLLRAWRGQHVTFEGRELPILGQVSMDMIVVDIADAPHLQPGEWIDIPYDLPIAAEETGLSQYELLTVLGSRFERRYR